MKIIKIAMAITLWALFGLSSLALAEYESGAFHGSRHIESLPGLTEDQSKQVRAIMQEQDQKRSALDAETRQRLAKILNAEQMQQMESSHHGQRDSREGGRSGHMVRELDLTAEQKTKVEEIFASTHSEHEAMEKANLSGDQKRSQMEALHTKTREKLAAVLKPEQLTRFDEMHARHMKRRGHNDYKGCRDKDHEHRQSSAGAKQTDSPQSAPN